MFTLTQRSIRSIPRQLYFLFFSFGVKATERRDERERERDHDEKMKNLRRNYDLPSLKSHFFNVRNKHLQRMPDVSGFSFIYQRYRISKECNLRASCLCLSSLSIN